MEQGFRYEKDCLSKKEETTCIGSVNSVENPKRFNVKRVRNNVLYFLQIIRRGTKIQAEKNYAN